MTQDFVLVYTTLPDQKTAESLGRVLVQQGLAACVNIYSCMTSIYAWEENIEQDAEVGMFIKTRRALIEDVMKETETHHPYELPALIVIPITDGSQKYLDWLGARTSAAG